MKKSTFLPLFLSAFIFLLSISSCDTSKEKVEKAEKNVIEAKDNLDTAKKNYQADIDNYKRITADRIAANEKSILELNAKVAKEKKEAKADHLQKVAELEKKNEDMKKKLENYKAEDNDKWTVFKIEFNNEMDNLEKSIKELISKDKK